MNVFRLNQSKYSLLGIFTCLFLIFITNVQAEEEVKTSVLSAPVPAESSVTDNAQTVQTPGTSASGLQPVSAVPGSIQTQAVQAIPCECCECYECTVREPRNTLKRNLSATTCFNCRTNGSYKFPVPRQNTYFWPGIYSQKTMTEYVAPYQGLKLRSPSEVFNESLDFSK